MTTSPLLTAALFIGIGITGDPEFDEEVLRIPAANPNPVRATTPHSWGNDFLDPHALTRLNAVARAAPTDGRRAFGGDFSLLLELSGRVGVAEGVALSARAPLGVQYLSAERAGESFFGNLSLGFEFGRVPLRAAGLDVSYAVGLELYLPTAPAAEGTPGRIAIERAVALRAHAPQQYVPQLFAGGLRTQVGLEYRLVNAKVELSLVPGVTVDEDSHGILLLGFAARVGLRAGSAVEPFFEVAVSRQVAGSGLIAPPLMVTPGVRFHITDFFDPAIFASLNFVEPGVIIFGLDLGGALREAERPRRVRPRERAREPMEL